VNSDERKRLTQEAIDFLAGAGRPSAAYAQRARAIPADRVMLTSLSLITRTRELARPSCSDGGTMTTQK
jgi:hypothetical protein